LTVGAAQRKKDAKHAAAEFGFEGIVAGRHRQRQGKSEEKGNIPEEHQNLMFASFSINCIKYENDVEFHYENHGHDG
jgi:hypothetical protein